ncbi:glycosyltransferase family 4 protein [Methylocella sp.]|uniref:glycosyltransferase family 4 protein n=1 Tax=Methylocella sp. TaxID=1978226 RepID=UPI003783CC7D
MRPIYINGRFLTQPMSGVQRYAYEIVKALDERAGAANAGQEWMLLAPPGAPAPKLRAIGFKTIGTRAGHLWDQTSFAHASRGGVALSLAMSGPLFHPRHLVILHDAAAFRRPEHFSRAYGAFHRMAERILSRTARIGTVSQFSRRELAAVLGLDAQAILVAGNGADHAGTAFDESALDRHGLRGEKFFLTLGNLTRNKNLAVAARALGRLRPGAAKLVAVGSVNAGVFGAAAPPAAAANVIFPGRLPDAEVAGLMRAATAFIFPSLYEGFGVPPLEAMANGCPVLSSNAEAMREVCGDAVDYFSPTDDARLAHLMREAVADAGAWRARRIDAGRARVKLYSWRNSARVIAEACLDLAAAAPARGPLPAKDACARS